jgi:nitronate monooxygenase
MLERCSLKTPPLCLRAGACSGERGAVFPLAMGDSPLVGESFPLKGEDRPLVGESCPLVGENLPPRGETFPLRGETFPLVGGTVPLKGESRPLVGENLPLKGGNRPLRGGTGRREGENHRLMRLRTPLTDLLGIDVPILQSGMGRVAGPELAAEVSRAGGLGILAGLRLNADELRRQISRLRELTDRPFGVNLWLHPEIETPVDAGTLPEDLVEIVQDTLNRFREQMDLPTTLERPKGMPDVVEEAFEAILDERVPVFSIGLGDPGAERVRRCHERGIKVIAMAATVEDARALAASGVDAIVAQGGEAGGHRSTWVKRKSPADVGTFALVPQVVDAVSMPVIAAGGIADGRGLLAALALGASGVMLGTRFVATRESQAPEFWKRSLLERQSEETTITNVFTGLHARAVRNTFADEYAASGAPLLPPLVQSNAAEDIYMAAAKRGDGEHFPQFAGQSLGLIHDLPGAAEVVERIVEEARATMARLPEGLRIAFR